MTWITRFLPALLLVVLTSGCSIIDGRAGYVDATAWSANYTEDYIYEFHVLTAAGKDTGLWGKQVKKFSQGGTGSRMCCALIPGVGQTIRIVWKIGGWNDLRDQWKTYSKVVVVKGTMPKEPEPHSYVIIRFFPNHEVEAELIPGDDKLGPRNPRSDQLFLGRRVMRHFGE